MGRNKGILKSRPDLTVDDIYDAWVASGRNATATAAKLGMTGPAVQFHVRQSDFERRYVADFNISSLDGVRRMAALDVILGISDVIRELKQIIHDPQANTRDKILAIKTYRSFMPEDWMTLAPVQTASAQADLVDTVGEEVPSEVSEQVRRAIEANVAAAAEARRRR